MAGASHADNVLAGLIGATLIIQPSASNAGAMTVA
jgi:hypothetical protein